MQTAPFVGSKIRTKSGMEHLFKLTHFIKKQKLLWATKQVESYAHLLLVMLIYGRQESKAGWWHLFRLSHLINVEKLWKLLVSGYGRLTHLCKSNVFSPSFSIKSVSRRVNGNVHKTYMLGMRDGTLSCAPYWANLFCQHGKLSICRRICPSWNKPEYGHKSVSSPGYAAQDSALFWLFHCHSFASRTDELGSLPANGAHQFGRHLVGANHAAPFTTMIRFHRVCARSHKAWLVGHKRRASRLSFCARKCLFSMYLFILFGKKGDDRFLQNAVVETLKEAYGNVQFNTKENAILSAWKKKKRLQWDNLNFN